MILISRISGKENVLHIYTSRVKVQFYDSIKGKKSHVACVQVGRLSEEP